MINKPPTNVLDNGDEFPSWYDLGLFDGDERRRHFIGKPASGKLSIRFSPVAGRIDLFWTGPEDEVETALEPLQTFIQSVRAMRALSSGRRALSEYKPRLAKRNQNGTSAFFVCTMPDPTTGYCIGPDGCLVWFDDRRFPSLEREVQELLLDITQPDADDYQAEPEPEPIKPKIVLPKRRRTK